MIVKQKRWGTKKTRFWNWLY